MITKRDHQYSLKYLVQNKRHRCKIVRSLNSLHKTLPNKNPHNFKTQPGNLNTPSVMCVTLNLTRLLTI